MCKASHAGSNEDSGMLSPTAPVEISLPNELVLLCSLHQQTERLRRAVAVFLHLMNVEFRHTQHFEEEVFPPIVDIFSHS